MLRKLWSGDSVNIDKALQLLYLVDIVALWGEHMYKPFAGACIGRLQAKLENEAPLPLEETLLAHQLEINIENFSWLFPEQHTAQGLATLHFGTSNRSRSQSQSCFRGPQSPQLLQEIRHVSLTSNERDYIIPERDCFIWLLDRDLEGEDLLIVRIDEEGFVSPPLLIFDSATWQEDDFHLVIEEEQARLPDDILADFRFSQDGRSYMTRCIARSPGYFREPQSQFCAIIPLNAKTYRHQLEAEDTGPLVFKRLELLLRLPELIDAAEYANDRWCHCQAIYNRRGPSMIQCNNVKCPMGWYHNKCLGLDEDFAAEDWFCYQCLDKSDSESKDSDEEREKSDKEREDGDEESEDSDEESEDSDEESEDSDEESEDSDEESEGIDGEIREASYYRVQRIRTLARVWKDHQWPAPEKVRRLINKTSCRININEVRTYNTVKEMDFKESQESRCWAIQRGSPKVMRAIRPAESFSLGNRRARNLGHRKSDYNVQSLAANSSLTREQSSDLLTVPQEGYRRRSNIGFGF